MINLMTLDDEELIVEARTWPSGTPYTRELVEELADRLAAVRDRLPDDDDDDDLWADDQP